jgi:Phosphotransferase enzyme family
MTKMDSVYRQNGSRAENGLPTQLEQITPEWLSDALQGSFPGVKIAAIVFGEQNWGTASSTRLNLTVADSGGHDIPPSIYIKGGFDDKWRKRAWMVIQIEAIFYRDVAQDVDLNILDAYFARNDDSPQGIVLLEDLRNRGARPGKQAEAIAVDRVASILEAIAKVHADWWNSPKLEPYIEYSQPQRTMLKWLVRPAVWSDLISRKHGKQLEGLVGNAVTAQNALVKLWEILDKQPRTLQHGDLHTGNVFWEHDGRPGFIDWQCFFAGNYVHDMSWIIVTALDIDQRRANERDLIKMYLDVLGANKGDAPTFDEAWLAHRQSMAHALSSYGATPANMFSIERTECREGRVYAACEDLNFLEALGMMRG